MKEKKVLVCVDGSPYSKAACDYGIFISTMLKIPLVLLHIIERNHIPKNASLAGNIGLGSRDTLLDELSKEEEEESKSLIAYGRKILQELGSYAKEQGVENTQTLLRHGTFDETLKELSDETKIAIIGLRGHDNKGDNLTIGKHVEEIIRALNIPILLVNKEFFTPINSMLMAHDGSEFADKAIEIGTKSPIFVNVKRIIVNVNKDESASAKLLSEAKDIFNKAGIEVETVSLKGNKVDEILKYQEENSLDIIAMGAYSHNRLRSVIFGSFTSEMLLKSKKPLLLFR